MINIFFANIKYQFSAALDVKEYENVEESFFIVSEKSRLNLL